MLGDYAIANLLGRVLVEQVDGGVTDALLAEL